MPAACDCALACGNDCRGDPACGDRRRHDVPDGAAGAHDQEVEPMEEQSPDWPRPVVHWEIESRRPEELRAFYRELFNWRIADDGGPITWIPAGIGGPEPGPSGHIRASDRSGVTLYVQVADLEGSLAMAAQLGGAVVMGPIDVPGGPTLAAITDPEGNPVTLVQQ
jgi:predicted enzyme related to lactoylglutathione lyase